MQNLYRPKVYLSRKQKETRCCWRLLKNSNFAHCLNHTHTRATQLKSYTILHHHKKFPNNSLCFEKKENKIIDKETLKLSHLDFSV